MNAVEIIFLILGFLSVSISFFIGNKENKPEAGGQDALTFSKDVWTEKEEQLVREQITRILNEERENIVVETTNLSFSSSFFRPCISGSQSRQNDTPLSHFSSSLPSAGCSVPHAARN